MIHLVALQRSIVVAIITIADDTYVRGVDVYGVTWKVGELLVRSCEDERRVLSRGNSASGHIH